MADPVKDWREGLAPELKDSPALKDVADVGTLAKNYIEAQSMIGRSIRLPSKDAGTDDRTAFTKRLLEVGKDYGVVSLPGEGEDDVPFWKTLGYPEKPDAYVFDGKPPEGVALGDEELKVLREVAHKAKLTPKQFRALTQEMLAVQAPVAQEGARRRTEGDAALKKDWGAAYDTRRAQVGAMLKTYGAPEMVQQAFSTGAMDASSTRWLYEILGAFGNEPIEVTRNKNNSGANETQTEILERVAEIEKRIEKMPPGDPEYNNLLKRRVALMEQAYPA